MGESKKETRYHIPTMERQFIVEALKRTKNRKAKAADLLGINVRTLHRKIIEHNIN